MSASFDGSDGAADGDTEAVHVMPEYCPFYWLFAGLGVVLFYYSMGYAKKYNTMAAFLLPPFICFCIIFDNAIMATTGINRAKTSVQAMLAFHACIAPMTLLVCYEIAYLVHKQKSMNFCGISFESGHRRTGHGKRQQFLSMCLRFVVWMIGVGLLVLNLLVSYRWSGENASEIKSIYDLQGNTTIHAIFSVLPALVLVLLSLFIGIQLWNYGTAYSYIIHATRFNPWIWMLVGSLSLLAGYLMPSPIYALSSNAGELFMLATVVRMFREVHHDMQEDQQMRTFIDPIATNSPQSQTARDVVVGNAHSKYELHSMSSSSACCHNPPGANASNAYVEVVTPKESEVRLTDADRHGQATAFLSVVVASSRTNPLFSGST